MAEKMISHITALADQVTHLCIKSKQIFDRNLAATYNAEILVCTNESSVGIVVECLVKEIAQSANAEKIGCLKTNEA